MWKVIIADDEPIVREGLQVLIDWKDLGYDLIEVCSDGAEVLEAIEKNCPDILILDIQMPVMTGLEVAKYIYEKYPEIYIILLTAHAEFKYAKEAIEYQVKKYIVKTNLIDDLSLVLKELNKSLEEEKGERKIKDRDILSDVLDYIDNNYMHKLSLEGIAGKVYVNKFYLSRLFKEKRGENLFDYINKKRIEKSKYYIQKGNKKIYEIADMVGLYDTAYFSKLFKKYTGYSPKEYARRMESE